MKEKLLLLQQKVEQLYGVMHDERTPWLAHALLVLLVAYILSPIDVIPDFVPVLGLLDELILANVVLYLVYRIIPQEIMDEHAEYEMEEDEKKRLLFIGIIMVVILWLLLLGMIVFVLVN